MEAFYTQFIQETFDETGQITHWAYTYADNYNYSYDVIGPPGGTMFQPSGHAVAERPGRGKTADLRRPENPEHPGRPIFFKAGG